MPAKTDRFWQEKAFALMEEYPDWSNAKVTARMEEEAAGLGRDDAPSERTVRRLKREHRKLSEAQRAQYRVFHWPAAMEREDLAWELSGVALELTRMFQKQGLGRPTVRLVRWTSRVLQAAPDCPLLFATMVAALLSTVERLRGLLPENVLRALQEGCERYLVDASWRPGASGSTWSDLWSLLLKHTWLEGRLTREQAATLWTMFSEEGAPVYRLVNAHIQAQSGLTLAQVLERGRREGLVPEEVVTPVRKVVEEMGRMGGKATTKKERGDEKTQQR